MSSDIVIYAGAPLKPEQTEPINTYTVTAFLKKAPDIITLQGTYIDQNGAKKEKEIDLTKDMIDQLYK